MIAVDHVGVAHPGDAALGADVGGHALERHHGDRAGVLGDLRLLGGDDVHDHAALEHLGHAALDARGAGARAVGVVSEVLLSHASIVRPRPGATASGSALERRPEARPASAWRRTTQIRWTTVTVLATASTQRVTLAAGSAGRSRSAKTGQHQDRDEPVGALGDADLGLHAERLGLGPGVRRDRAHHQAVRAQSTGRASCRPGRRSRAPGRRRSRASPIRSSVESRNAPNVVGAARSCAPCAPSIRSLKTNAVITRTPASSSPCGKKTRAPARHAERADERHRVGADPEPDEAG